MNVQRVRSSASTKGSRFESTTAARNASAFARSTSPATTSTGRPSTVRATNSVGCMRLGGTALLHPFLEGGAHLGRPCSLAAVRRRHLTARNGRVDRITVLENAVAFAKVHRAEHVHDVHVREQRTDVTRETQRGVGVSHTWSPSGRR